MLGEHLSVSQAAFVICLMALTALILGFAISSALDRRAVKRAQSKRLKGDYK